MDQSITPVLLDCLACTSDTAKKERLTPVSAVEWSRVVGLAEQHNVAPLLYDNLRRMHMAFPDEITGRLKQAFLQNMGRMMAVFHDLSDLLRLLQENDIPVIVLKGAYLAEAVYKNIGLRMMGDIDLMVKKDDLMRVDKLLLAYGCLPEEHSRVVAKDQHHFRYLLPGSRILLEIHWTIIDPTLPLRIDVETLWSRAQPVTLAHAPALTLAPEDLLLHLCLHTACHTYEMRLSMICDIKQVVWRFGTELNWQEIGAHARQWGAVRAVYVMLRLAQELLGVPVPADWLASLRPEKFNERYLDLVREQILIDRTGLPDGQERSSFFNGLTQLWGTKGFKSKLALLRDRLLPPRETLARLYPVPVNSWRIYLYIPVFFKDIWVRRSAALWRLLRRDPEAQAIAAHTNQVRALQDWLMSG
jgi:hypothetical protein